ncbi:MAG: P1 family peptidase [Chloroflexi bacterium]|nr:P1 family peptidase [Chloroflexota bacterium]
MSEPLSMANDSLTAIPGFRVGQVTDREAATGCTVVLCPPNTVGGVDQRGGAPGTRETDALRPTRGNQEVHGVMLAGGSAYGLAAADGAMRFLEEQGVGYRVGADLLVPIVPAAIIFDLALGAADVRPDAAMGYEACQLASAAAVEEGTVGAGTGARVGGLRGNEFASKGGVGSACEELDAELKVAALMVVNAVGDVLDESGAVLAGLRRRDGEGFEEPGVAFRRLARVVERGFRSRENTVIGVVATNARLSKAEVNKVAQMAHNGIARAVMPAHTMHDGDTIFALSSGAVPANVSVVGMVAAEAVARAIRRACRAATSLAGVRAIQER